MKSFVFSFLGLFLFAGAAISQTKLIFFKSHSGHLKHFDARFAEGDYGLSDDLIKEMQQRDSINKARELAVRDSLNEVARLQAEKERQAAEKQKALERKKKESTYKAQKQAELERKKAEAAKKEAAGQQQGTGELPKETIKKNQGDPIAIPPDEEKKQSSGGNQLPLYVLCIVPVIFWMSKKLG